MTRPTAALRAEFPLFMRFSTRWSDNDAYGHVNNALYHHYFDAAVNRLLIEGGALDPVTSVEIGLVVESNCTWFASLKYPEDVEIGLSLVNLGTSSVTYRLGAFAPQAPASAALARYTHVYVNRHSGRPVPVPDPVRRLLAPLAVTAAPSPPSA
ncbi:MAG: acyl-CoA thioesterase [Hyphomicrobiales bacterium]|nr:acyl-CoA thioesterase [Hyphomicrobiales bacterium]